MAHSILRETGNVYDAVSSCCGIEFPIWQHILFNNVFQHPHAFGKRVKVYTALSNVFSIPQPDSITAASMGTVRAISTIDSSFNSA